MPAKKRTLTKVPKKPGQTGRKLLDIDEDEVYRYAMVGMPTTEIALMLGCNEATIRKRFSETLTKAKARINSKLRAKQIQLALQGDKTMLVWLGKNMLNQSDSPSVAIQNNLTSSPSHDIKRTKEEDEAFLKMFEKVVSGMGKASNKKEDK
ncbi:MAG: hypothetical protein CL429_03195 [Acidimicrobiaceae bacterium]|nr:hypothetical protein [Acidimicrobiaceae bacterium]|tara:strand:- start:395 stop:847 length:453 start_codon:yes stop_codon:yes gene_type:complete